MLSWRIRARGQWSIGSALSEWDDSAVLDVLLISLVEGVLLGVVSCVEPFEVPLPDTASSPLPLYSWQCELTYQVGIYAIQKYATL